MNQKVLVPTIYTSAFIFLCACAQEPGKKAEEEIIPQLIIGDPTSYGSDSLIMFPVGMTYIPKTQGQQDDLDNGYIAQEEVNQANGTINTRYNVKFSEGKSQMNDYGNYTVYDNEEMGAVDMRNLIFYNQFTGESQRLFTDKLHIISFSVHYEFGDEPIIMYDVVKNDYNQDSLFDRKDPVMLYVSDMGGNNFTQLTPEDETYLTYFYYRESGRLLLKVSKDGDENLQFDPYDQTIFREVDLKNPAMGETLFGDAMIEELKEQI